MLHRKTRFQFVVFFTMLFLFALPVSAIEFGGLGGRPANPDPDVKNSDTWFIYNLGASERQEDAIIIQNLTEQEERVLIYPADTTPSSDGGFALKQRVEEMTAVGSWIRLYPFDPPVLPVGTLTRLYPDRSSVDSIISRCEVVDAFDELLPESMFSAIETARGITLSSAEQLYVTELMVWCEGVIEHELLMNAGEITQVPLVITIPEIVDVGEHAGGILIQKVTTEQHGEGAGINLTTRVGVRVYETVPGDIFRGVRITNFTGHKIEQTGHYTFGLSLESLSNISQEVLAEVTISGSLFDGREYVLEKKGSILRSDELTMNFDWEPPVFGRFLVTANVVYDSNGDGVRDITLFAPSQVVWAIPWKTIMLYALLVLFIAILIWRWWFIRHRLADHQGWAEYRVKKGDTLVGLSQKYEIPWRRIVTVNRIPKPYTLQINQTLLLPTSMPDTTPTKKQTSAKSNNKPAKKAASKVAPKVARKKVAPKKKVVNPTSLTEEIKPLMNQPKQKRSTPVPLTPRPVVKPKHSWMTWIIVLLIVAFIAVVLGVWYPGLNRDLQENSPAEPSPAVETLPVAPVGIIPPEEEVIIEEEVVVVPEDVALVVLNGSGVPGLAGSLKGTLEELGYTVTSTGNADSFNYATTLVRYADADEKAAELVELELVDLGYEADLESVGDSDQVLTVIIGRK